VESPLTPTQALIVEQLRRPDIAAPAFEADLADQLTEAIEDELAPLTDLSPTKNLFISKHPLSTIHACEAHYLATSTSFEWSIPTARGSVAHRAIELSIHWRGEAVPLDLVDEAMAKMVEEIIRSGLTRDEVRRLKTEEKKGPGRPKGFIFHFRPSDNKFALNLRFKRAEVSKEEIIATLRDLIDHLSSA